MSRTIEVDFFPQAVGAIKDSALSWSADCREDALTQKREPGAPVGEDLSLAHSPLSGD
jgi:hypothetical protein